MGVSVPLLPLAVVAGWAEGGEVIVIEGEIRSVFKLLLVMDLRCLSGESEPQAILTEGMLTEVSESASTPSFRVVEGITGLVSAVTVVVLCGVSLGLLRGVEAGWSPLGDTTRHAAPRRHAVDAGGL